MARSSIANHGTKEERGSLSRPLAGLKFYREHGEEFRSLGAGRYEVPSRSRSGKRHEININHVACTCEDHEIRGFICAHIYAIVIAISTPVPIPSRKRFRFSPEQIMANVEAMGA